MLKGNKFLSLLLLYVAILASLSIVVARHLISPRIFAFGVIVVALMFGSLLYAKLKQRSLPQAEVSPGQARPVTKGRIRIIQLAVGIMVISLIFGLIQAKGTPILPNLVGTSMNLLITCSLLRVLRAAKQKRAAQEGSRFDS